MKAKVKNHSGKRKSISGKLNISILSVLVPSLIILILVSCTIAAKSVTGLSAVNLNAQAENAVNRVDNFFTNKLTAISMFANNTRMQMYLQTTDKSENTELYFDSADIVNQLKHMLDSMSEQGVQAAWLVGVENATYLMDDGQMVACNFEETVWDEAIYNTKKAAVSEPFLDPVTGNMVISIVSPVFSPNSQEIIGFAGFDVFQDSLGERLSQIKIGQEGYLELFSNDLNYIYSKDASVINKSVDAIGLSSDFVSRVKNRQMGALTYSYDGTAYNSVIKECASTGWLMIANQPLAEINTTRNQIVIVLTLLSAVILVILTAILWIIVKKLTKPIQVLTTGVEEFANGRLNVEIDVQTNDEIGVLSDSIKSTIKTLKDLIENISGVLSEVSKGNLALTVTGEYIGDFLPIKEALLQIVSSLNKTLGQINESADQVSSGADQVSSGTQALSQGATEQASSIEELAATINEISKQINDSAQNAALANNKSNTVGAEAAESSRRMHEMLDAMEEISQSSDEIGKIIKAIEDIAFQTNILALNAAVEAARAGAAGKGFAVVADEVRNLASKSAEASKNTASLIEKSLKSVEHGTKIANETASSLNAVVDGVKEVGETIEKVSSAAKEQAQSIAQVTVGVDQISSVVQTNSATAEESAAASEELSGQAQLLKNLISKFQIQNGKKDFSPDPTPDYIEPAADRNWDSSSKY